VPLAEFQANLRAIVQHLHKVGVHAVVLITPPPVSEADRLVHVLKVRGPSALTQVHSALGAPREQ
jgi:hypothetical protein